MRTFHLYASGSPHNNVFNLKYPNQHEIKNSADLAKAVERDHMFSKCKNSTRDKDIFLFLQADCIVADFDNDREKDWITPDAVISFFEDVELYIVPSRHNMQEKNGKSARPRFHVYFPVSDIKDPNELKELALSVTKYFPEKAADTNVAEPARFIFGVKNPQVIARAGSLTILEFVKRHPIIQEDIRPIKDTRPTEEEKALLTAGVDPEFLKLNIRDMLDKIPSDDYGIWVNVGMGLKSEGFSVELWDEWSRKSAKYPSFDRILSKWKSFKSTGSITGGTIARYAQSYGWKCEHPTSAKKIEPAKEAIKSVEKKPEVKPLQTYWASDLEKEDLTPPEFIVKDILPPGLTIFGASPKMGKSFLMLSIASAIAEGSDFWGKKTKKGTVLYLDIESSKYRVKDRLKSLGLTCPSKLAIAHRSEQLDAGLLEQLNDFKSKYPDTVAIIIDTLGRVKGAGRSRTDAYTQDTQLLAPLQTFAIENSISVMVITHLTKENGYQINMDPYERITGSNGQFGVADAAWMIVGKRNEAQKHFLATGRDMLSLDWTIERQSTGGWTLKGDTAKINLEAEYNEYLFAPLSNTIRDLVSIPGSSWSGTSTALSEKVAEHTGQHILSADIGREVKKIAPMLLKYDNIIHIPPDPRGGRKGRVHIFRREETL